MVTALEVKSTKRMSEPTKSSGVYRRAESGARGLIIVVGSGVMAYTVGGVVSSGLAVRLAERLGTIQNVTGAFFVAWGLQRVWQWLILPAVGWGAGRFLSVSATRFAIVSSLTGELFGALLTTATGGVDMLFLDWPDFIARVVTFALGGWLVFRAIAAGQEAAELARVKSAQATDQQKAEYAAFLAGAERKDPPGGQSA